MEAIRNIEYEPTFEDRQRAVQALHELQNMFKDDAELQSMSEEDIVQTVKEIRREIHNASIN